MNRREFLKKAGMGGTALFQLNPQCLVRKKGMIQVLCGGGNAIYGQPLVADGDSNTSGAGVLPSQAWPAVLATTLGLSYNVTNIGIPGDTLANMVATNKFDNFAQPHYVAGRVNVAVQAGGINDVRIAGANQTNFAANLTTYGQHARSLGWKFIACTLPKEHYVPDWTQEAADFELATNNWIRANWTTFADALADFAANSAFSDTLNTLYYQSDRLHHAPQGHVVKAGLVFDQLASL